jgi:hypothetical protein
MNKTSFTRFTLATLLAAAALPVSTLRTAQAQPPSGSQNFTTRIYIQNPNPNAASGIVNFFDEMGPGNPRNVNVPFSLNPNGSTEILVGSLTDLGTWKGSAVISADQPVVAASIQVPSTGNYGHMMANAFTSAEGTSTLFLTTFLRNVGNEVSLFGVQNIENEAINIRARFISVSPSDPQIIVDLVLQANTSKFFDAANAETTISPGFPGTFNGSASRRRGATIRGLIRIASAPTPLRLSRSLLAPRPFTYHLRCAGSVQGNRQRSLQFRTYRSTPRPW